MRTKTTEAFKKYIDPVFICQNHLWFYVPKNFNERFDHFDMKIENYNDEQTLRAGMCVFLAEEIEQNLSFSDTLKAHKKKMFDVASNWDIDAVETERRIKDLESTLFAHAKMQYCFNKYVKDFSENNDIEMLACLMAMYAKIMKTKKQKQPHLNIKEISHTKFYKYVKEAFLEECGRDIKNYSQYKFKDFSNAIFDMVAERCYDEEHLVDESMLSAEGDAIVLKVYSIEHLNDINDLKQEMEEEVREWTLHEIRKQDGLIFDKNLAL